MDKILRKPHIWNLHIHTSFVTPTKQNYSSMPAEEFVDEIIKILKLRTKNWNDFFYRL